jgi:hypothetical protein
MSIEPIPEVNLDAVNEEAQVQTEVSELEKNNPPLVTLRSSPDRWDNIKRALLELRAANISAVLLLKRTDFPLDGEEIKSVLSFLRDWDQLLLHNVLEISEGWVPKEFDARLQTEAKIELKWFREWLMALADPRIHKYPGLPWRSFVRKIVSENYQFATELVRLVSAGETMENLVALDNLIKGFLEAKKKVVCIFPKRWGKS